MAMHGEAFRSTMGPETAFDVPFKNSGPFRYGRIHPKNSTTKKKAFGCWESLGEADGPLDAGPDAKLQINEYFPAGYIFLGQFIAHDMTFDPTSIFEQEIDPRSKWNYRTPRLDLDSIYGSGPHVDHYFYDPIHPELFSVPDGINSDLPRTFRGTPVIADPRNDQNLLTSQLHLAFLKFHNFVVEQLRKIEPWKNTGSSEVLSAARKLVRWHYHWIILQDYLERICLKRDTRNLAERRWEQKLRFYNSGENKGYNDDPFIPIEFSSAIFRFGHSQINPHYALVDRGQPRSLFDFLTINSNYTQPDWNLFFGSSSSVQFSKKISRSLPSQLFNLPKNLIPRSARNLGRFSLPMATLNRGAQFRIASGNELAKTFLSPEFQLTPDQIWEGERFQQFRKDEACAPLWYYILREAEVQPGGLQADRGIKLGPLGSKLVFEIIVDLISASESFPQDWNPLVLRKRNGNADPLPHFDMLTLLNISKTPWRYSLETDHTLRSLSKT